MFPTPSYEALEATHEGSVRGTVLMEERNQALCVQAGYIEEGARAFIERRKPRYAERA